MEYTPDKALDVTRMAAKIIKIMQRDKGKAREIMRLKNPWALWGMGLFATGERPSYALACTALNVAKDEYAAATRPRRK